MSDRNLRMRILGYHVGMGNVTRDEAKELLEDDPDDLDRLENGVCETCGAGSEEPHLNLYHALRGTEW